MKKWRRRHRTPVQKWTMNMHMTVFSQRTKIKVCLSDFGTSAGIGNGWRVFARIGAVELI